MLASKLTPLFASKSNGNISAILIYLSVCVTTSYRFLRSQTASEEQDIISYLKISTASETPNILVCLASVDAVRILNILILLLDIKFKRNGTATKKTSLKLIPFETEK